MLSKVNVLGSSSDGCAYILYFDNGTIIQLDAGVKNINSKKVSKLFISHRTHCDHDKYLKDFNEKETMIITPTENKRLMSDGSWCSFTVPHKVLNNGYIIHEDGQEIAYITDCGDYHCVELDLSHTDILFIECNWDYFLIKDGVLKAQAHSAYAFSKEGHMSNLDCLNALSKWNVSKDCKIIFVHKSGHHANYETTYKMFDALPNKKYVAKKGETLYVKSWKAI